MSLKIYKYNYPSYGDLMLIGNHPKKHPNNPEDINDIKGCVIGVERSKKEFPIGHYEPNWGGFKEVKTSVSLRSKENLFTNGKSVIIRNRNRNMFTLITNEEVQNISISYNHNRIVIGNEDMIWYDGGVDAGWYKRVDEVKFNTKK